MERLRLAAVGEFIAQNTGDDAGALTAQTQQWLLDAQSVIPQPLQPYIDLSGEVFAESGWILDTASGTVFSAIRASLHHTPFIDTIILLDAQTGRLLHLEMLFYQESDYLILLQDLPDSLEDTDGWRQRVADYYGLMANAFRPEDSLVKQWYSTAEPSELGSVSYTHLDVYKRQGRHREAWCPCISARAGSASTRQDSPSRRPHPREWRPQRR